MKHFILGQFVIVIMNSFDDSYDSELLKKNIITNPERKTSLMVWASH